MTYAEEENIRKQYFKSWASYQIPIKPTQPISYQETEGLTSYYLGYYNKDNLLVRFIKFLKRSTPHGTVQIEGNKIAGSVVYFLPENTGLIEFSEKNLLSFEQTSDHFVYYKGRIDSGEKTIKLELVQTDVIFVDDYVYWSNGKLKSRNMQKKQTGEIQLKCYDETGMEIQDECRPHTLPKPTPRNVSTPQRSLTNL